MPLNLLLLLVVMPFPLAHHLDFANWSSTAFVEGFEIIPHLFCRDPFYEVPWSGNGYHACGAYRVPGARLDSSHVLSQIILTMVL